MTLRQPLWIISALLLLAVMGVPPAHGDEMYTYTGKDFSAVTSPLTKSDFVSGYFTVSGPLVDNLTAVDITSNVLKFSFTDGGVNTITSSALTGERFVVSTDAMGNITAWDLTLINGTPHT